MITFSFKPLLIATALSSCLFFSGCVDSSSPQDPPMRSAVPPLKLGLLINESLMIPPGQHGRHARRTMRPRFLTIHSTQNRHASAGARMHAIALHHGRLKSKNNSLGYLTWHYTVDAQQIYRHLPDHEQGQHADYEGLGNRASIGIELCENRGNSLEQTLEHSAKLAAYLMRKHRIPLSRVVPHQHWRMIRYSDRKDLGHKNCPHFLMDGGKPGAKWLSYKNRIKKYL